LKNETLAFAMEPPQKTIPLHRELHPHLHLPVSTFRRLVLDKVPGAHALFFIDPMGRVRKTPRDILNAACYYPTKPTSLLLYIVVVLGVALFAAYVYSYWGDSISASVKAQLSRALSYFKATPQDTHPLPSTTTISEGLKHRQDAVVTFGHRVDDVLRPQPPKQLMIAPPPAPGGIRLDRQVELALKGGSNEGTHYLTR
jgi:hypothetical protein